jgi:hypothetical protein
MQVCKCASLQVCKYIRLRIWGLFVRLRRGDGAHVPRDGPTLRAGCGVYVGPVSIPWPTILILKRPN